MFRNDCDETELWFFSTQIIIDRYLQYPVFSILLFIISLVSSSSFISTSAFNIHMPKTWSGLIVLLRKRLWRRVQIAFQFTFWGVLEYSKYMCVKNKKINLESNPKKTTHGKRHFVVESESKKCNWVIGQAQSNDLTNYITRSVLVLCLN